MQRVVLVARTHNTLTLQKCEITNTTAILTRARTHQEILHSTAVLLSHNLRVVAPHRHGLGYTIKGMPTEWGNQVENGAAGRGGGDREEGQGRFKLTHVLKFIKQHPAAKNTKF